MTSPAAPAAVVDLHVGTRGVLARVARWRADHSVDLEPLADRAEWFEALMPGAQVGVSFVGADSSAFHAVALITGRADAGVLPAQLSDIREVQRRGSSRFHVEWPTAIAAVGDPRATPALTRSIDVSVTGMSMLGAHLSANTYATTSLQLPDGHGLLALARVVRVDTERRRTAVQFVTMDPRDEEALVGQLFVVQRDRARHD